MTDAYEIQGQKVRMPVVVRDAGSGNAMFRVDAAAVAKLLPGDAFEVLEIEAGVAQLILGLIDYRDNDLGDYNEAAIIFFVKPRGAAADQAGTFIYRLPVNQLFTCEAGCKIWGFPKSVEEVDIVYTAERASCRLVMDGRTVFSLSIPRAQPETEALEEGESLYTYTYIDGVAHRTGLRNGGRGTTVNADPGAIELELGDHPLADELRGLGLPAPALMSTWTEHMSGVFEDPERL